MPWFCERCTASGSADQSYKCPSCGAPPNGPGSYGEVVRAYPLQPSATQPRSLADCALPPLQAAPQVSTFDASIWSRSPMSIVQPAVSPGPWGVVPFVPQSGMPCHVDLSSVVATWQPPTSPRLPDSLTYPDTIWAPGGALATAQGVLAEHWKRNRKSGWQMEHFHHTYKGKRPGWAQPVTVWYDTVDVESDLPNFETDSLGRLPRPRALMGIVLPSKTVGRGPAKVYGADLARTGWDKGHLMALSLGGIDERLAIIPQPRPANQELEDDYKEEFEVGQKPSWRAMELYVMGLGTLILKRRYADLRRVLFNNRFKRIWRLKEGVTIATNIDRIQTYAGSTVLSSNEPDWHLVYYVEPTYSAHWPGNIADSIWVDVIACTQDSRIEVLSYECDWESALHPLPFGDAEEYETRAEERSQQKRQRVRRNREAQRQRLRDTAPARIRSLRKRSPGQRDAMIQEDDEDFFED